METIYLITPISKNIPLDPGAGYIGIDAGAKILLDLGITPIAAIGDFDSMSEKELETLKEKQLEMEIFPVRKDETDLELALRYLKEKGWLDQAVLWDSLKGRLDHTLATLILIGFHYPQVIMKNEKEEVRVLLEGNYTIEPQYRHLSFFALEPSIISEKQVSYELDHREIFPWDIYTVSNSFTGKPAEITIEKGRVLCVLSNKR